MFRNIKNQVLRAGKGNNESLPASMNRAPASVWRLRSGGSSSSSMNGANFHDGSAASIHTTPTLQLAWQRATPSVRYTWISFVMSILMVWFGWRWIRYYSAGIYLNCHSQACEIQVIPIGWDKKVVLDDLSRLQLHEVFAVKTDKLGNFITEKNIDLTEARYEHKGKHKKYKSTSNYKGPDENGHFLSYALALTDITTEAPPATDKEVGNEEEADTIQPPVDLKRLHSYMSLRKSDDSRDTFLLIPRHFGVRQSKRRVRTMVQKIDAYIKGRRQKLMVRENSPPSWQGVLLMVFGCIGTILTILLGLFRDETTVRGPGVRRLLSHQKKVKHSVADSYAATTPARFEVNTTPASISTVKKAGYRQNTTQVRKRP